MGGDVKKAAKKIEKETKKGFNDILGFLKPELPDFPELPEFDATADRLKRAALINRMREQAIRGTGRTATIATSPLGVLTNAPLRKQRLKGN